MANSTNDSNATAVANTMSKFQTVAAAQAWWNAKSPAQKGATLGLIAAAGMGGYAFFATYKVTGISVALWNSVLYGSIAGASVAVLAQASFTPKQHAAVKSTLGGL